LNVWSDGDVFGCTVVVVFFFFQAEDGIRDRTVTGVQTCALPIYAVGRGGAEGRPRPQPAAAVVPRGRAGRGRPGAQAGGGARRRSEERRVGKECRSRWSP